MVDPSLNLIVELSENFKAARVLSPPVIPLIIGLIIGCMMFLMIVITDPDNIIA
jgi:hypothetical protein